VTTARDWLMRGAIALAIALVGGIAGGLFGNFVEGAVRSSEITALKVEAAIARTERKEAAADRAALRREVAATMQAILTSVGELRGEITGLTSAIDRMSRK